jgi:hypothetical protein
VGGHLHAPPALAPVFIKPEAGGGGESIGSLDDVKKREFFNKSEVELRPLGRPSRNQPLYLLLSTGSYMYTHHIKSSLILPTQCSSVLSVILAISNIKCLFFVLETNMTCVLCDYEMRSDTLFGVISCI